MSKLTVAAATALLAATASAPAAAQVYTYNQTNGAVLKIDVGNKSGTLTGPGINASFTSAALGSFTGGVFPTGMFNLDTLTGTRTVNGVSYAPNTLHQQKLVFGANNSVNLWSYWGSGTQLGDYVTTIGGYTPPPVTSSSGGSGGSSGGPVDVPAPSMLLLFGAAAATLVARRKRRQTAA